MNYLSSQCGKREVSDPIMRERQLKTTSLCIADRLRGQSRETPTDSTGWLVSLVAAAGRAGKGRTVPKRMRDLGCPEISMLLQHSMACISAYICSAVDLCESEDLLPTLTYMAHSNMMLVPQEFSIAVQS